MLIVTISPQIACHITEKRICTEYSFLKNKITVIKPSKEIPPHPCNARITEYQIYIFVTILAFIIAALQEIKYSELHVSGQKFTIYKI